MARRAPYRYAYSMNGYGGVDSPVREIGKGKTPFLRRLLVATDGMDDGMRGVEYAVALAQRYSSELVMFYAFERIPALGETDRSGALVDAEGILSAAFRYARDAGISATTRALEGSTLDMILRSIDNENVDAIVMGTRNERGAVRLLEGSVSNTIVRRADVPVFVVSQAMRRPFERCSRILVAVDDSAPNERAADFAATFARADGAELVRCAVVPGQDTAEQIVDAATSHDVGAIVVGTHGRSGVQRLFIGSVAEGVLRRSQVPVAFVRDR
jgi:nucleotide-binding universal stress UspA family protein